MAAYFPLFSLFEVLRIFCNKISPLSIFLIVPCIYLIIGSCSHQLNQLQLPSSQPFLVIPKSDESSKLNASTLTNSMGYQTNNNVKKNQTHNFRQTSNSTSSKWFTSTIATTANGCLFCPTCANNKTPYAGWTFSSFEQCKDRSVRCAEFSSLCLNSLYKVFLRSHCARTCGYCLDSNGKSQSPSISSGFGNSSNSSTTLMPSLKRQMLRKTASRKNGTLIKNNSTLSATTTTTGKTDSMNMLMTTTTTTMVSITDKTLLLPNTTINARSMDKTPAIPSENIDGQTECEDIGQNCKAMADGCTDMNQREILGTFCRSTCGFC